jgi:hypothetical protein
MGRTGLSVDQTEVNFISSIIQSLLDRGHRLYLNDRSQLTLNPPFVYNQETRETELLRQFIEWKTMAGVNWNAFIKNTINREWRLAGRVRNRELKQLLIAEYPEENAEDNMWNDFNWNQIPESSESSDSSESSEVLDNDADNGNAIEGEEDGMCIVCYEAEAETYLQPCEHIIVCESCSDKLATEQNIDIRDKCIYCRQDIESIIYLKSGKVINK